MLLAVVTGRPLLLRHCGNWFAPRTIAEHFWKWFMERFAGGRNVMLATGGAEAPPSARNPAVRWVFSTSLREEELGQYARRRQLPTGGELRLVTVARQEPAKGTDLLIRALSVLLPERPELRLIVVGEGSALPALRQLVCELELETRVEFTGRLDHSSVLQRLGEAHLFCCSTSSSEGFPKAVLEALACGLPVVTTRVSVLPQLIGQGGGILLDEATPTAVASAIEQVLSSPRMYLQMSEKAIETARQYSLEAWRDEIGRHCRAAWGELKREAVKSEASVAAP
jgi:glycosyltransferase involved in cell wall biosynthesis